MIDFTKPLQTRDGREVKIFMTDAGGQYPVLGACKIPGKEGWHPTSWTADGQYFSGENEYHVNDLANIAVKQTRVIEGWVNVYPDHISRPYWTEEEASYSANNLVRAGYPRIACVPFSVEITFTEGEGL